MRKIILLSIISLFFISSCVKDPYSGEIKLSNTAKYGAGGAIVGAITGKIAGKNRNDIIKRAMIGTVTGGTIGAYFDNQEKILRKELSNSGVSVERNQNGIKLIMPGNITFATNSSDIRSDFYKILNSISKIFKKYKNTNIIIEGFTDSSGSKQYNQILSEKRAKTVYHYLASQDISEYRIFTYGRGENSPIASNKTKIGKAKNRRVEIKIVPQG